MLKIGQNSLDPSVLFPPVLLPKLTILVECVPLLKMGEDNEGMKYWDCATETLSIMIHIVTDAYVIKAGVLPTPAA